MHPAGKRKRVPRNGAGVLMRAQGYFPDFDMDLSDGLQGEDYVHSALSNLATIEVKTDRRAHETGNLYIEVYQFSYPDQSDKRPSGLSISKAKHWVFTTPGLKGFIVIQAEVLKDLIRANSYKRVMQPIANAKTNGSIGILVPISDIKKAIGF
jgi:hypothetical protein